MEEVMSQELDDDLKALEAEQREAERQRLQVEYSKAEVERSRLYVKQYKWESVKNWAKGFGVTTAVVLALGGGIVGWHQYWGGGPEARHAAHVIEEQKKAANRWEIKCERVGGMPAEVSGSRMSGICTFPDGTYLEIY
jgi:hypothetical protein